MGRAFCFSKNNYLIIAAGEKQMNAAARAEKGGTVSSLDRRVFERKSDVASVQLKAHRHFHPHRFPSAADRAGLETPAAH